MKVFKVDGPLPRRPGVEDNIRLYMYTPVRMSPGYRGSVYLCVHIIPSKNNVCTGTFWNQSCQSLQCTFCVHVRRQQHLLHNLNLINALEAVLTPVLLHIFPFIWQNRSCTSWLAVWLQIKLLLLMCFTHLVGIEQQSHSSKIMFLMIWKNAKSPTSPLILISFRSPLSQDNRWLFSC